MTAGQTEGRSRQWARDALARVDMHNEFPVHDHYIYADNGDGTITVSVPWSDFTVTAEGDQQDAKKAMTRAYKEFFAFNEEEQAKLAPFMEARGYLPLSGRN